MLDKYINIGTQPSGTCQCFTKTFSSYKLIKKRAKDLAHKLVTGYIICRIPEWLNVPIPKVYKIKKNQYESCPSYLTIRSVVQGW